MSAPAVLRRVEADGGDVVVARGPLIILAHGLMAIPPDRRDGFRISTAAGDIGPAQAEALLRGWMQPASAA